MACHVTSAYTTCFSSWEPVWKSTEAYELQSYKPVSAREVCLDRVQVFLKAGAPAAAWRRRPLWPPVPERCPGVRLCQPAAWGQAALGDRGTPGLLGAVPSVGPQRPLAGCWCPDLGAGGGCFGKVHVGRPQVLWRAGAEDEDSAEGSQPLWGDNRQTGIRGQGPMALALPQNPTGGHGLAGPEGARGAKR